MNTKEEALAFICHVMEKFSITCDELRVYQQSNLPCDEDYPFELLFTDGTRSFRPQIGKVPWGVVFENFAICLKSSEKAMIWNDAQDYSQRFSFNGKVCSCGKIALWRKVLEAKRVVQNKLNDFIISLGGEPLQGNFWSATFYGSDNAWVFVLGKNGGSFSRKKSSIYKVRLILEL